MQVQHVLVTSTDGVEQRLSHLGAVARELEVLGLLVLAIFFNEFLGVGATVPIGIWLQGLGGRLSLLVTVQHTRRTDPAAAAAAAAGVADAPGLPPAIVEVEEELFADCARAQLLQREAPDIEQ